MRRNIGSADLKMREKPVFIAFAVSGSFLHGNSLDLVKKPLHSFCLLISYKFVTFENNSILYAVSGKRYNICVKEI